MIRTRPYPQPCLPRPETNFAGEGEVAVLAVEQCTLQHAPFLPHFLPSIPTEDMLNVDFTLHEQKRIRGRGAMHTSSPV